MNTETLNQLKDLKLDGMAQAYQAFLSLPLNQRPSQEAFINQLIESEKEYRTEKRKTMFLRLSTSLSVAIMDAVVLKQLCLIMIMVSLIIG